MLTWDRWLRLWRQWADLPVHRRRVDRAARLAREGSTKGRMFASISGGKDSVALLGVLREASVRVQCVHASSSLNLPESLDVSENACDRVGFEVDIIEPERDALEMLLDAGDVTERANYQALLAKCSAGDLLVEYAYRGRWDGWFDGRRADENQRTRGVLFRVRGPLFQSLIDDCWQCSPLAWWTVRDSFAACVAWDLPIHPYYRRCAEIGIDPETVRVDWLFGPDGANAHGACVPIRRLYPDHWRRLTAAQPALAAYA